MLALAERDYANAQCLLKEAADIYEKIGRRSNLGIAKASLGYLAWALDEPAHATEYLCEALRTYVELHGTGQAMAIPTAALLLADAGRVERAVEIYAMHLKIRT